jgi:hypothetical protein
MKFKAGDKVMIDGSVEINNLVALMANDLELNKVYTVSEIYGHNEEYLIIKELGEQETRLAKRFKLAEKYLHEKAFNKKMEDFLK